MKKFSFVISALWMVVISTSCASESKMIAAAKELDRKYMEAFNKADLDAYMETYWKSPEALTYLPTQMEVRGWNDMRDASKAFFESVKGAKGEFVESNYKVAGEYVIGWGKWLITLPDSAGTQIRGRYTDVKAKRDGKWVYILDHGSVPLPPASPASAER